MNDLPGNVNTIADAASRTGWHVTASYAEGPPASVALIFTKADGHLKRNAYGLWKLTTLTSGKVGVSWSGGSARQVPPGRFATLGQLRHYLDIRVTASRDRQVTYAEGAQLVGVPETTLRRWRHEGRLEPVGRRGRQLLFSVDQLFRVERDCRRAPRRGPATRFGKKLSQGA